MKYSTLTICTGLVCSAIAQAGDVSSEEIITPPAAPTEWSWFVGGSLGYVSGEFDGLGAAGDILGLDDWDEPIYTLHVGTERMAASGNVSHAFFIEVGYTKNDESVNADQGLISELNDTIQDLAGDQQITIDTLSFGTDMEIIPITYNYKYESCVAEKLNWYVGAGAGFALVDTELSVDLSGTIGEDSGSIGDSDSDDDTVFYAHIFAGLTYNVSETFELFGGVRYIFMDDIDINLYDGLIDDSIDSPLDGAVHVELGARYNF